MNKYPRNKVKIIALGMSVACVFFTSSAIASRWYHRVRDSYILEVPAASKAATPSSSEYRSVTAAEAKKFQDKGGSTSVEKTGRDTYHEIGNTRIVKLKSTSGAPPKGYETEEQYLKSKKDSEAKAKSQ